MRNTIVWRRHWSKTCKHCIHPVYLVWKWSEIHQCAISFHFTIFHVWYLQKCLLVLLFQPQRPIVSAFPWLLFLLVHLFVYKCCLAMADPSIVVLLVSFIVLVPIVLSLCPLVHKQSWSYKTVLNTKRKGLLPDIWCLRVNISIQMFWIQMFEKLSHFLLTIYCKNKCFCNYAKKI